MLLRLGYAIPRALFGEGVEAEAHRLVDVGPWSLFPILSPFLKRTPKHGEVICLERIFYAFPLLRCLSK